MLSTQLTSFVGRQRELAELESLVATPERVCRLVTLVGPGGVGKTRLALDLAGRLTATEPSSASPASWTSPTTRPAAGSTVSSPPSTDRGPRSAGVGRSRTP
jgi:AAA ATPase domain